MWPLNNPNHPGQVSFLGNPAWGHQVEVAADVGATLHIEPNDIPQAGTPTDIWFALTATGGTIIPLEHCDCALTVYDQAGAALATPALSPTTAEGYENIPGSTLTFPTVGAYELVLSGQPSSTAAGAFAPFELRFEVTVAGTAAPPPATPTSTATVLAPESQEPSAP
ncbi:MAG: hypothetical protein O2890_00110, partial [Cyanobacteria bacterium]|nr:hypothetical protein [Cyanobacteriota bacterium]